jgi:hypothetical protein
VRPLIGFLRAAGQILSKSLILPYNFFIFSKYAIGVTEEM